MRIPEPHDKKCFYCGEPAEYWDDCVECGVILQDDGVDRPVCDGHYTVGTYCWTHEEYN